jgi:hypothetical protein
MMVIRKAAHGNVHCQARKGGFIAKKRKQKCCFLFVSVEYVGTKTNIVTLLLNTGVWILTK